MNYYSKNTSKYISNTLNVDMKEYYDVFLSYLNPSSKILDVSFDSGRVP